MTYWKGEKEINQATGNWRFRTYRWLVTCTILEKAGIGHLTKGDTQC